ncbi:MAG: hypothetical protein IJU72_10630 [Bacteroidales bacterium]|nr:hypothetical protein [Bacteroidales bacterium]
MTRTKFSLADAEPIVPIADAFNDVEMDLILAGHKQEQVGCDCWFSNENKNGNGCDCLIGNSNGPKGGR